MEDEPQFDDHSPPATESSDQLKEEVLPSVRSMDESEAKELDPSNPPPQCEDAGRERSMEVEDARESSKVAERDENAASLFREEGEGKDRVFEKLQKAEVDEKVSFLEGEDDKSREFDEEKFSDEKVPTLREEDVKGIVKEEEEEENVSVFDDGAQLTEQLKEEEEVSIVKDEKVPISETSAVDETMQECDEEKLLEEEVDEKRPPSAEKDDKVPLLDEGLVKEDEKVPLSREEFAGNVEKVCLSEEENEEIPQTVEEVDKSPLLDEDVVKEDEKVPMMQEESAENEGKVSLSEEESGNKDEKQEESIEKDEESSSDKEEDEEMDMDEGGPAMAAGRRTGSKRKRGRPGRPRTTQGRKPRAPPKPKEDEELCFICFDGGDLVVCDHRGCPKVYHPSCVNRDEDYFKAKGQWNCGWHICSNCQKSARYMCYTCTYSLCKRCIKDSGFACVRGNKGFCETCMKTVMLIETDKHENETKDVDFDDKTSWMYLFKDYWVDLKAKLSLSLEEITSARNPVKETNAVPLNEESLDKSDDADDDKIRHITTRRRKESTSRHHKESTSSKKKVRKRLRNSAKEVETASTSEDIKWASNELLEFVAHMKNGDRSVLSQFDVQALLLQYIKQNNLRDPRRKSQVVCDLRLQALFGKARVGHLEMLKLLEPHFLLKEASPLATDENQGGVVDPDPGQMDVEGNSDASTKMTSDSRRKSRRTEETELPRLEDYAAIDVHNVSLMYLRRNLMEEILDDTDMFTEKVVGSFVRIRISNICQTSKDMYRLVQVVGIGTAAGKYKTGQKITDITLEILNLNKREFITIDAISNQTFTEEECRRLRQSVKCGFIDRLTVDAVHEKARALQTVRVNDWLENEKLKLGHLRDRASEKGRKKEHRECVEKLQRLSMPEELERRLNEAPEVHVDPHMDPDYESTDDEDLNAKNHDNCFSKPSFNQRGEFSTWKNVDSLKDSKRSIPKAEVQEVVSFSNTQPVLDSRKSELFQNQGNPACQVSSPETPKTVPNATSVGTVVPPQSEPKPQAANTVPSNTNETEKMWHYQDPSGKTQGPFTMVQLRKWSTSGLFPTSLRIWRTSEKQEDSILLTDALSGKYQKESQLTNIPTVAVSSVNNSQIAANFPPDNFHTPLAKSDGWTPQQPQSNSTSTTRWESSNNSQMHSSMRPIAPFSRNSSRAPNYQGRDFRGDNNGRWNNSRSHQNNWNPNRGPRRFQHNGSRGNERQHTYRGSSSQQFPANSSSNQTGSSSLNQQPNNIDWASLQGALNRILPSPSPIQSMNSGQNNMIPVVSSVQPVNPGPCTIAPNPTPQPMNIVGGWAAGNSMPNVNPVNIKENVCVSSNHFIATPSNESVSADALKSESVCSADPLLNGTIHDSEKKNNNGPESGPAVASSALMSSALPDASVSGQRSEVSTASRPQSESQTWVPVLAHQQGQNVSAINPSQAVNMGWGMTPQIPNPGMGAPQQIGNMVYTAMPSPANMGWGLMAQGLMNMSWGTPTNVNMGWGPPSQAPMNANFAIPTQGNANVNMAWGGAQAQTNPNSGFGVQMQVAGQGSMNNMPAAWAPPGGNPHSWNPQQQQQQQQHAQGNANGGNTSSGISK